MKKKKERKRKRKKKKKDNKKKGVKIYKTGYYGETGKSKHHQSSNLGLVRTNYVLLKNFIVQHFC